MSNKMKFIWVIIVVLIVAGLFGIRNWKANQNKNAQKQSSEQVNQSPVSPLAADDSDMSDEELAKLDQQFETQCVSGEWAKIADVSGDSVSLNGKLRMVYPEDNIAEDLKNFQFYIEGNLNTPLSGSNLSALNYFEDRDVEVQGVKSSDGKSVEVGQIRCAGAETDKAAIDARMNFLNWARDNINSIAPKKAPYQKWTVDTAEFADDNNVYIEYYDTAEDDENANVQEDTYRKLLLEIDGKSDSGYDVKTLAYWEMGEDDYTLVSGADKLANQDDSNYIFYTYNPDEKSWERI
jgi:hypothetical protein